MLLVLMADGGGGVEMVVLVMVMVREQWCQFCCWLVSWLLVTGCWLLVAGLELT